MVRSLRATGFRADKSILSNFFSFFDFSRLPSCFSWLSRRMLEGSTPAKDIHQFGEVFTQNAFFIFPGCDCSRYIAFRCGISIFLAQLLNSGFAVIIPLRRCEWRLYRKLNLVLNLKKIKDGYFFLVYLVYFLFFAFLERFIKNSGQAGGRGGGRRVLWFFALFCSLDIACFIRTCLVKIYRISIGNLIFSRDLQPHQQKFRTLLSRASRHR